MIRVGLLDNGIDAALAGRVVAAADFTSGTLAIDPAGHGSALARAILHHAPDSTLLDARAFGRDLRSSPAAVGAALRWVIGQSVQIVNLSIGLREERAVLREAVAEALDRGLILVASTPARGGPVYPAAYPGVLRVTGDARCEMGEVSKLGGTPADYGACPKDLDGTPRGASFAAAHVSGLLAAALAHGATDPRAALDGLACYEGREHRHA